MLPAAPIDDVVQRLERLFPGLAAAATARHAASRTRMAALWARAHPGQTPPWGQLPLATLVLGVDAIIDHARALGAAVDGRPIDDRLAALAPGLAELADEPLWVVTDDLASHYCRATELLAHARGDDLVLDGDLVCVATCTPRVLILHHEDWIFDLRAVHTSP